MQKSNEPFEVVECLDQLVTIVSQNEFGLLLLNSNSMVDSLLVLVQASGQPQVDHLNLFDHLPGELHGFQSDLSTERYRIEFVKIEDNPKIIQTLSFNGKNFDERRHYFELTVKRPQR